jgi:hypothetical protein
MPTIAIVDGILIVLYFNDHVPPHFHARGADFHARIRIDDGSVIEVEGRIQHGIAADCLNGRWPTGMN